MSYLEYWSLYQKPFAHNDPGRLFAGSPQREFLAGLNFLAVHDGTAAVLASQSGCGTTSLLRQVAGTSGLGDCAVEVLLTSGDHLSRDGVLQELAASMGLNIHEGDLEAGIRAAVDAGARSSVKTIWLVDQCRLPAARIAGRLIASLSLFTTVLVARPAAADHLAEVLSDLPPHTPPIRMEIGPLSLSETADYVRRSISLAGGRREIWMDSAIIRLFEFGKGQLAPMSLAAEAAMILAARHRLEMVGPALVEAASGRMGRAA